jgi:hypothetical protein
MRLMQCFLYSCVQGLVVTFAREVGSCFVSRLDEDDDQVDEEDFEVQGQIRDASILPESIRSTCEGKRVFWVGRRGQHLSYSLNYLTD